jgi:hypothetical protein
MHWRQGGGFAACGIYQPAALRISNFVRRDGGLQRVSFSKSSTVKFVADGRCIAILALALLEYR